MSKYSGKCDVYDSLVEIHKYTDDELKNNVKIYKGDELLNISCKKDLIPYYPYIITCALHDNNGRNAIIHITTKSYVDIEEEQYLNMQLEVALKEYRKSKRKKALFNKEETLSKMCIYRDIDDSCKQIVDRVDKYGNKANIDGIHANFFKYYRENMIECMIENDINPVDYGYGIYM